MTSTPWYQTGDNRYGAYQSYTVAIPPAIAKIPDGLSFEKASVYPMNAAVAAGALFTDTGLGLERPADWRKPVAKDKTLLIWGGSTSVGGYAIQLATMVSFFTVSIF